MSTARKLRTELATYLEPFGLSVQAGTHGTLKSRPGSRSSGVQVFDGDRVLTILTLDKPEDVVSAVRHVHKLRPDVPLLVKPKPPRASRSRKAPAPTAPMAPRPVSELEALFAEPVAEPVEDEGVPAHTRRDDPALPAASAPRPTTQAPPWDAIAAAARVASERAAVAAPAPSGFEVFQRPPRRRVPGAGLVPGRLLGCDVIARVRKVGELDDEVPDLLVQAAATGLRRGLPTWLARDDAGRLTVLVTNGEPVAA